MKTLFALVGMSILNPLCALLLLITGRLFIEARLIQSPSMQPAYEMGDHVLIEKVTGYLRRPYARGDIILFYAPPIFMDGKDLSWDLTHTLGRLTGLPFFPYEAAFLKRVIGIPGDRITIEQNQGVFLNGQLLSPNYVTVSPNYDLAVLGDIGGESEGGNMIRPYSQQPNEPIIVPPGQLFVLGDNRPDSNDSHVFGFLNENRVVGRVQLKFSLPTDETAEKSTLDES